MKKQIELSIFPDKLSDKELHRRLAAKKLKLGGEDIFSMIPNRRSVDARKEPVYKILYDVYINEKPIEALNQVEYKPITSKKRVIIVGFGPGGMYCRFTTD